MITGYDMLLWLPRVPQYCVFILCVLCIAVLQWIEE